MTLSEREQLEYLRKRIRGITREIFRLFGQRFELARTIGGLKESAGLPTVDSSIENDLRQMVEEESVLMGLDPDVGQRFLTEVFRQTIQAEISDGKNIYKPLDPTLTEIVHQARAAEAEGARIIHLELGEPDLQISSGVIERTIDTLRKGRSGYQATTGSWKLRDAIASYANEAHGVDLQHENILVSPGARFAVFLAMASSISWGDEVIIPSPNWGLYNQFANYLGARVRTIRTEYNEKWSLKLADFEDSVSRSTKMIVLSHPNNPTGKILDKATLKSIVELASRQKITLLSDEAYSGFTYAPYTSLLEFVNCKWIVISSFSRTHSMTAFRIGYAISSPEIVKKMASLQRMMIQSVPEFIQEGATEALTSREILDTNYRIMKNRVSEASTLLSQYPVLFHKPDGGVYIFLKRKRESETDIFDSTEFSLELLKQEGVAVCPGSVFGDRFNNFIRISLYQPKEVLFEGIRRLGEALS